MNDSFCPKEAASDQKEIEDDNLLVWCYFTNKYRDYIEYIEYLHLASRLCFLQKGTDSIQHQLNLYLIRSFKCIMFYGEEAMDEYFDECFLVLLLVLLPLRSQGLAAWG